MNHIKSKGLLLLLLASSSPGRAQTAPAWWTTHGIISTAAASEYSPANTGQMKYLMYSAISEMALSHAQGPGSGLLTTYSQLLSTPQNSFAAVNGGQWKNAANPFYSQMSVPFPAYTGNVDNYALINVGQTKNLFSFGIGANTVRQMPPSPATWGTSPWISVNPTPATERERKFRVTDTTYNTSLTGTTDIQHSPAVWGTNIANTVRADLALKVNDPSLWSMYSYPGTPANWRYTVNGTNSSDPGPEGQVFVDFYFDDTEYRNSKNSTATRLRTRFVSGTPENSVIQLKAWRNSSAVTAGAMERIEHQTKLYLGTGPRPTTGWSSSGMPLSVFPTGFDWATEGYYEVEQYRDQLRPPGSYFESGAKIQEMLWPFQKGYAPSALGTGTSTGEYARAYLGFLAAQTGVNNSTLKGRLIPRAIIVSQRWRITLRVPDSVRNYFRSTLGSSSSPGGEIMLCSFDTSYVFDPVQWIAHQLDVTTPLPTRKAVFSELEFQIDEEWSPLMKADSTLYKALQADMWRLSKVGRNTFKYASTDPAPITVSPNFTTKYQQALQAIYPAEFNTQP